MKTRLPIRLIVGLVLVGLLTSFVPVSCHGGNSRASVVAQLTNLEHRDEALAELMRLNEMRHTTRRKINHVLVCPQESSGPLYAVFVESKDAVNKRYGLGPGKPLGGVKLFDSDGNFIPYYCKANFIQGIFADVNGDGIIENIDSLHTGSREESWFAKVLHVISITKEPRPILCIAYDRERKSKEPWAWRAVDLDNDGILEIQFGPVIRVNGNVSTSIYDDGRNKEIDPIVTYRWSADEKDYVGPDGGNDRHFERIDPENRLQELGAFARSG